jgi:type I restriction enzyme S subunit
VSISDWRKVKLGDVIEINKNSYSAHDNWDYINYLDTGNITENRIDSIQYLDTKSDKIPSRAKRKVNANEIIYSTVRPNQKHYGIIKKPFDNMLVSTGFAVINGKDELADNGFLYWYLTQEHIVELLHTIGENSTSAYPSIKPSDIEGLDISLPSLPEQKAIAATLSALDDMIELNNKVNKTLEEMAQAIFKSWFVDFEPFRDGEFEESELGLIPKGWRVGAIDELIKETISGDWGKETPQGNYTEKVICIRGADIPDIAQGRRGNPATRYILKRNLEKKRLSENEIIIEISGGSPTQSTGRTVFITKELINSFQEPIICTNFCRTVRLKEATYSSFVYSLLQYLYNEKVFFTYENGTTGIKNLDITTLFGQYKTVIPSEEVFAEYHSMYSEFLRYIYESGFECKKLSEIRDTLLPKLISGEIRVPVEEVV